MNKNPNWDIEEYKKRTLLLLNQRSLDDYL